VLSIKRFTGSAICLLAAVCVLSAVGGAPASAQDIIPKFRVKAGVFAPDSRSLKDVSDDAWVKIGADLDLPLFGLGIVGKTRVGIDYAFSGSNSILPITLIQVWQPSLAVRSPLYLGAGIGLWTVHTKGGGTASRFGFRLLAGVDLTSRLFLEGQYDFVSKVGSVRTDGLSILVGMKF
jgi:hypothetical protein